MRKEDLLSLLGGAGCLAMAAIDDGWRLFWLIAGVVLIVWSAATALRRKRR